MGYSREACRPFALPKCANRGPGNLETA
jgi:hypothetical protein